MESVVRGWSQKSMDSIPLLWRGARQGGVVFENT